MELGEAGEGNLGEVKSSDVQAKALTAYEAGLVHNRDRSDLRPRLGNGLHRVELNFVEIREDAEEREGSEVVWIEGDGANEVSEMRKSLER